MTIEPRGYFRRQGCTFRPKRSNSDLLAGYYSATSDPVGVPHASVLLCHTVDPLCVVR